VRIVYMGTPEFAVPSLQALLDAGHEVAAAFTQPDKPKGRKQVLTAPPVKVLAQERGIPVFQPATLRTPEAETLLRELAPELIVVAAYGKILPKAILELPKYGCVNVHASLLPKYRGAAPIQWALINGEENAGVTTMQMAEGIDTGDMLLSASTPIGPEENAEELTARLAQLGASLLVKTLEGLQSGTVVPTRQDDAKSCYVSMLSRELSPVDWSRSAIEIHNQIRGLFPWPAAETFCEGKRLKLYRSRVAAGQPGLPGTVSVSGGKFTVSCGDGTALELLEVQPENGKRMNGGDFLRGHPAIDGTMLK
jgi:methionyl-tRNA formyltransferase